jgi:hypothetical protein
MFASDVFLVIIYTYGYLVFPVWVLSEMVLVQHLVEGVPTRMALVRNGFASQYFERGGLRLSFRVGTPSTRYSNKTLYLILPSSMTTVT